MKTLLLWSSLLYLSACGLQSGGHGSGSSGGDPLQTRFEEARLEAVAKLKDKNKLTLNDGVSDQVKVWLVQNFDDLREDIKLSKHVWISGQDSCGKTDRKRNADIHLSIDRCAAQIIDRLDAVKLIVHESVHHFGVGDEQFADQVAIITASQASEPSSKTPIDSKGGTWIVGRYGYNDDFNIEATESMHLNPAMYFYHPTSKHQDICHFVIPKPLVWSAADQTYQTKGTFKCDLYADGTRNQETGDLVVSALFLTSKLRLVLNTSGPFVQDYVFELDKI